MERSRTSGNLILIIAVIILLGLVAVSLGWYAYRSHHATSYQTNTAYGSSISFSGTVTADGCATSTLPIGDVGCSITVGNNTITVVHGNAYSSSAWGSVEGVSNIADSIVGRKVAVYAHQLGPHSYDLAGSTSYYVKLLN